MQTLQSYSFGILRYIFGSYSVMGYLLRLKLFENVGVWMAQSVQRRAWARFSLLHSEQIDSGAHPASNSMGIGGSFPGVKRLGREANHSPPTSAEFKNRRAIPPLPHISSWHNA
jgi:hypothetical protein